MYEYDDINRMAEEFVGTDPDTLAVKMCEHEEEARRKRSLITVEIGA